MNVVITGGGSGGHIFAGVSIAQAFKAQSSSHEILFIGSEYGLETKLIPKAGFSLSTIKIGKLVGQNIIQKLLTLLQIPWAVLKCMFLLKKFKTKIVIGVGGYAAGPCILAARILHIPTGVLEQNAVMGLTNKISATLAGQVFAAFEIPEGVSKEKCIITGNPTRAGLHPNFSKTDTPFTIFAFGGSQGGTGLNRMMLEAAQKLLPLKQRIQIVHQTGEKDFDWVKKMYAELGLSVEVYPFIHEMQPMYDKASIVVCRAGSSTISELGATGNAAIFIPFSFSAGNHQVHNAELVAQTGGAQVLLEQVRGVKTHGSELANMIQKLMNEPNRLAQMRHQILKFHKPDAANQIVEVMKGLLKK